MSQDKTSMTTAPTDAGKRLVLELQRLSTLTQSVEDADTKWIKSDAGTQDGATAKAELFSALYGFYTLTKNWLIQKEIEAATPPSQGKVERARDAANAFYEHIKHGDEKHRAWLKEECDGKLSDLITQALTESSGQLGEEASAILRTLGSAPDNMDVSDCDAKISVGFIRRLIGSGQGTDGAVIREKAAKKLFDMFTPLRNGPWEDLTEGVKQYWRDLIADLCLPLPVSADGKYVTVLRQELLDLLLFVGQMDAEDAEMGQDFFDLIARLKEIATPQPKQPDTGAEK